ncbi:MAG: UvrD-helicase domain-containing protein, partial [Spirochaetes bacterium]|nr:UvrD-helicase domain-containing protein [Spirochaetota bacterium]
MVKSILCTASAGAGKTYRLTQEIFQRIQFPNRFVVAVTFTKAAAAEMERRLLEEISGGEGAQSNPTEKLFLIMRASKVHFSTLDSLFYLFLSTESYVPQISDDQETNLIHRRAKQHFFYQKSVQDRLSQLEILARILHIEPEDLPETLYKEAGLLLKWSCKEEEWQHRQKLQEILKNRFLQYQNQVEEIARTYCTEEAYKQLHKQVILHLLKPLKDQPAGCLIECQDLDEVGTGLRGIPEEQRTTEVYAKLKEIYPQIRRLVAEYIINTQKLRASLLREFAEAYVFAVEKEKQNARRIFFEDVAQILANLDGGEEAMERPALLARLYELGFHTVTDLFLDEFQDTSRIQLELLRPLLEEILSSVDHQASGERSLFLVGDWKQSIYQWREADPQVLETWSRTYQRSGQLTVEPLTYNWRSTPLLIGFFNNLVNKLFEGTEREKELQFPPPKEKRRAPYQGFSKVEVIPVNCDRSDEALYQRVVTEIENLHHQGVSYGDITILCRTHSHIRKVTEALAQHGIFTTSIKGREVLSTREGIALYLAIALTFLEEPTNGQQGSAPSKETSQNVEDPPESRNGRAYLERALALLGYGDTLLPWAKKCAEDMRRIGGPHRFSSLARVLSTIASILEPERLPRVVVEAVWTWGEGYFQYDEAKDIRSFLVDWKQYSSLITVPEPEHSDRVIISTIHGVKGLEFPHVFLLWKEEIETYSVLPHPRERFPLSLTRKDTRDFLATEPVSGAREFVEPYENAREARSKETANLLYVAATRAKQSLTILLRGNKDGVTKGFSDKLVKACDRPIDMGIELRARKIEYGWECQYEP